MLDKNDFKVIIVGGGVAGLALANMLEQYGWDYLILESHSAIAPQVGASIGMFPNGLRILDQLGLYAPIHAHFEGQTRCETFYTRRADGTIISQLNDVRTHLERRHGYPFLFFDRQKLPEIMYRNLQHKDRVLVNKRVTSIELSSGAGSVTCADGTVFRGTLVVGADGVHSTVRDSMTSIANKFDPGYFDHTEASRVPCFYRCSFGIAKNVPGWVDGTQHTIVGQGMSQLVVSGPENKVYWFLFERLPRPNYGKDIAPYSREDEAEFVRLHCTLPVTENITFG
ncbi:FAD-dependent monooxygenase ptmM like protein [Verticillium longisporum]|uniref:FAD-dependent monooxygenase ptmM like protein n=1 Tax=Verticillium longisporum TaxID=100787 RepID=A0A0G4NDT3_VERLO|nr:FAD-dependent monooxygenase ptmM like protein [Verticillium longisporum]CRK26626.1 hypothetical protein BN1708_014599 [Verticillium longisporum]CRK44450.1 hypothetical protein BN1723_016346 [Verticillium longisporum]